tara:strand:- start:4259 stop:5032 length:774 start_codon:yes stop_codon:yes gene_type:complete
MYLIKEFVEFKHESFVQSIHKFLKDRGFEILNTNFTNNIFSTRLKTKEVVEKPDYTFVDELIEENKSINTVVKKNFNMGKKIDNCSYYGLTLMVQHGVCKSIKNNQLGKLFKFIEKYNINSLDEFAQHMCHSIRDLNRYIKIKKERDLYRLKDIFIKFLRRYGYIQSIENHQNLVLFTTKFDNISYHSLPHNAWRKFDIDIKDLPVNDNDYPKKTYTLKDISDINKMKEVIEFAENLNNSQYINHIKNVFGEQITLY